MMRPLLIYGSGGHAKVIWDIATLQPDVEVEQVVDDAPTRRGRSFRGTIIEGPEQIDAARTPFGVVAIGNNAVRERLAARLSQRGVALLSLAHPRSVVARDVVLGEGTVVMAGAILNPSCRVGPLAIINTGATVDHDASIGTSVHIAPGVHVAGDVTIGDRVLVGIGAVVLPGVHIGADATIGAGAVLRHDVPAGATVVGNPARTL
ncbi:MAG: acetyltransferase [Planctomycetes bacterium]|nr:acetyltransferase [Planctomycetota bacterium]